MKRARYRPGTNTAIDPSKLPEWNEGLYNNKCTEGQIIIINCLIINIII
jgi:hypothetical protein